MAVFRAPIRVAFTLVELLVTLAIVALLLAVLVPALAQARDHSRTVICQAQLRELAKVTETYVQTFDGTYPDAEAFPYGPLAVPDISKHSNCLAFRLHPFMPDTQTRVADTWYCPVKGAVDPPVGLRAFGHGSYLYNAADLFARRTVRRASRTGLLRDYVARDKVTDTETALRYGVPHDDGQNVAFVDGHVEFSTDRALQVWGPDKWPVFPR